MDILVIIFAPAAVIGFVPVLLAILVAVFLLNRVEFASGFTSVFHSVLNVAGILITPIAALNLYVKSRRRKLPATLLTTLCFLMLQCVFLFMINYAGLIDGSTSNPALDSLLGYTIGWVPMLLYAIILGLGVRSGRCNGSDSLDLFHSVGFAFVFTITLSEWAAFFTSEVYTALFDIIYWSVMVVIFSLLVNFLLYAIVRAIFRLFANPRNL